MKSVTKQDPISALHEILKWSGSRPEWQRDALRRIVVNGTLDEKDINELGDLCRSKHKAPGINSLSVKAEPLNSSHIPPGPGLQASVTLVSVGNLQGVNRLPPNESIPFGAGPGITVVYGDNGTGKSGYARVIKKACRTRGAPPKIYRDAFATGMTSPATGTIVCNIAGKDYKLAWQDGVPCDPCLANVFVFDAASADHYLEQDGPPAFTPSGLDVLPKLSKICDTLSQTLKKDIDSIKVNVNLTARTWTYISDTSVEKLLTGLCANTKPADVEVLAGLNDNQVERLKEITDILKSDPKQKARETRAAATRLETFSQQVSATSANLSIDEVASLGKLLEHAKSAGEIAKAFAKGRFDSTYLPGTGEELWRQLWEAARSFSFSSAYKGQEFPVTGDGARCVLCQQTLDAPAEERLKEFDEFCKDQSQQLAEQSEEQFTLASGKVKRMMPLSPEYDKVEADFLLASPDELASIVTFVRDADERLATLKDNIEKRLWKEPRVIATLQANRINGIPTQKGAEPSTTASSVADVITALAARLKDRAKKEESADDPEIRKKMEAERDESAAREWLAGVKTDVLAQIGRYKEIAALEACLKDTSTTKITTKNTELTKCLVTDAFCDRFKKEAKELGLRTIGVKLEEIKGKKGETKFGLRLELNADQAVRDIASEGEKRCIALAAFLAELSQASHQSALMFDDPVSSFDHQYRQKTAERLVEKSKVRQVIVFTHDVVFLNDLQAYASDVGVKTAVFHLEWADNKPGQCVVGLPWDWKSAEDRLDKLEKEQRAMAKTWNPIPNEENIKSMRRAYSWLRATLV